MLGQKMFNLEDGRLEKLSRSSAPSGSLSFVAGFMAALVPEAYGRGIVHFRRNPSTLHASCDIHL